MTRLFLAASVAALAISVPAAAKPGGGPGGGNPHGGGGGQAQAVPHGGGNGGGHGGGGHGGGGPQFQAFGGGHGGGGGHGVGGPQFQAFGGGHGSGGGPRFQAFGGGHGGGGGPRFQAQQFQRHGGGGQRMQMQRFAMPRQQHQQMRAERMQQSRGFERRQLQAQRMQQQRGFERHQMQAQRQQMRGNQLRQAQNHGFERQQMRMQQQAQNRGFERQQMRMQQQAQNRGFERQQMRMEQAQNRAFDRQQVRSNLQQFRQQSLALNAQRFGGSGGFVANPDYFRNQQQAYQQALVGTSFAPLYYGYSAPTTYLAPTLAESFIGVPVSALAGYAALAPLPTSIAYLYPATPDYYYQYGDGYVYQIDRTSNLIAALIPLLAGGYMPGQYLPQPYMASYVPDYYGFNAFYPDYGDECNRYVNGVIYEVDCDSGMVEDVVPVYANGYGVGQILPTSYAYYNVPYQYRSMYYDTPDYNYWYAPGAIYQYDPRSSMITSVAALLSPGFTVGQPLPVGYDVYNVPYAYRATYYDTPNAWYRYNNGYIYQVDPVTRLVTAIVASLLT